MERELEIVRLGRLPYAEALALQHRLVEERAADRAPDRLLLLEHDPVVTLGRGFEGTPPALAGVDVVSVERGGEATFHGPGQLVGYPVVALAEEERDLHGFLRALEGALADALAPLGIAGERVPGATGLWVREPGGPLRKIASLGVAVRRWVTFHGFALNVSTDLRGFEGFRPCGYAPDVMTTVERCAASTVDGEALSEGVARAVASRLHRRAVLGGAIAGGTLAP